MEQANAIRSFEELQYLIYYTFDTLWKSDVEAREEGGWLIHITPKEDVLWVRNENLEKALAYPAHKFAENHDDREMGIRTIKRDFQRLGIIKETNVSRKIPNEAGEKKDYKVTVINLNAVDWIMDTPLLHDDTMAHMLDDSKSTPKGSWLRKWLEKTIREDRGE